MTAAGEPGAGGLPLVSIGVPVYNGERFLRRAVESLLAQSYPNTELIISDNASTDGTEGIAREFEERDPRVRYIRQTRNIGASNNWNAVAHAARGEFFKWASANDFCAPEYVEKCVAELRGDPGMVLCFGKTQLTEMDGTPIEVYRGDRGFEEPLPSERLAAVLRTRLNNAQQGVIRMSMLRRTRLDPSFPAGDIALVAELALRGTIRQLPDVLLFRRQARETFTSMLDPVALHRVFKPNARGPMKLIRTRYYWHVFTGVLRAPLGPAEKMRAARIALQRAWWEYPAIGREILALVGVSPRPRGEGDR